MRSGRCERWLTLRKPNNESVPDVLLGETNHEPVKGWKFIGNNSTYTLSRVPAITPTHLSCSQPTTTQEWRPVSLVWHGPCFGVNSQSEEWEWPQVTTNQICCWQPNPHGRPTLRTPTLNLLLVWAAAEDNIENTCPTHQRRWTYHSKASSTYTFTNRSYMLMEGIHQNDYGHLWEYVSVKVELFLWINQCI